MPSDQPTSRALDLHLGVEGTLDVELDGNELAAKDLIALTDDGQTHALRIVLG